MLEENKTQKTKEKNTILLQESPTIIKKVSPAKKCQ